MARAEQSERNGKWRRLGCKDMKPCRYSEGDGKYWVYLLCFKKLWSYLYISLFVRENLQHIQKCRENHVLNV